MIATKKAALPPFPKPLPAEAPAPELTRGQKLDLSFNYILSRIRIIPINPQEPLPFLMGGKGNLCSLAAKRYGISRGTLQDYICSKEDRSRLPEHLSGLAASISRSYAKAQKAKKKACLLFIQSKLLEVKEDLRKPLPLLQSSKNSLTRQAEKKYRPKAGSIVHWIYPSENRPALTDPELTSLAATIAPLYREIERAKKKAAYKLMVSHIQAALADPKAPLPRLTTGRGGLYRLASKEFHLGSSELQNLAYCDEMRSAPVNRELASLASSIRELHQEAWKGKVRTCLSSVKSSIILLIKNPSLPLPRLSAGEDSLFHKASLDYNFSERTISAYCREGKARYHLHDEELSELAASISPLYKLALFIRRQDKRPLSSPESLRVETKTGPPVEFTLAKMLAILEGDSGTVWWNNVLTRNDRTLLLHNKLVAFKAVGLKLVR